jgi:hypothetical protein
MPGVIQTRLLGISPYNLGAAQNPSGIRSGRASCRKEPSDCLVTSRSTRRSDFGGFSCCDSWLSVRVAAVPRAGFHQRRVSREMVFGSYPSQRYSPVCAMGIEYKASSPTKRMHKSWLLAGLGNHQAGFVRPQSDKFSPRLSPCENSEIARRFRRCGRALFWHGRIVWRRAWVENQTTHGDNDG